MNELMVHASALSAAAVGALVSAVWQGALLAGLVFGVLRLFPRLSAAARSVVWLNVFLLLVVLHVAPMTGGQAIATRPEAIHAVSLDPRWSLAVAAVWMLFSLVRVGQLVTGALHLRRMARRAKPLGVSAALEPLLRHNGHAVQICASNDVARPSVLGFFRPHILIPPELLEELSEVELRAVVLHEMEHLRRGDDWINLLQKVVLVLFPLNPALAWVERRLCAERELACDDRVLHAGSGRKTYAMCLTHLAEFALVKRSFSLVLGAWERRPELVRRVHRILAARGRSMGRRPALAAMGSVTAGALACTLVLARAPQVVRFAPVMHAAGAAQIAGAAQMSTADVNLQQDAQELGRELGGKAQLVKAVMPATTPRSERVHRAVAHRHTHWTRPAARLADLETPPPAQPGAMLVVTTAWTDTNSRTQMIVTFSHMQQQPRVIELRAEQKRPLAAAAAYAIVPTPEGWLVIQI